MTTIDAAAALRAANELTARWAEALPPGHFAVSGVGVWPLLALLQSGARGKALAELTTATGIPADTALDFGLGLISILDALPGGGSALGLWVRDGVPLQLRWASRLPGGTVERLPTDLGEAQAALDSWASEHTGGRIDHFPTAVDRRSDLILATALATALDWSTPFDEREITFDGRKIVGLRRDLGELEAFAIVEAGGESIGRFISRGEGEVDVHLLTAPESQPPAVVLRTGIAALTRHVDVRAGDDLRVGDSAGQLVVEAREGEEAGGTVRLPAFEMLCSHDLLAIADVFGLRSAMRTDADHFPEIAPQLVITQAAQALMVRFHSAGFAAAAVTSIGGIPLSAVGWRGPVPWVRFELDRPFGFLAVHRPTRLVLFAGWVATPAEPPYPAPERAGVTAVIRRG
ncbi:MAG TPA: serpin family protein [Acidimicrobiales bacterium]|nr:serpin family protein [Acidimicrobiales bacterium]